MEEGERNWDEKRGLKFYFICLVMPEFERPWTIFMRDAKIDEIRRMCNVSVWAITTVVCHREHVLW